MDKTTLQQIANGLKAVSSSQSPAQNVANKVAGNAWNVAASSMTPSQLQQYLTNEDNADQAEQATLSKNQASIMGQLSDAAALSNYLGQPVQAIIPALSTQPAGGYVQSSPSAGSTLSGTLAGVLLPAQQLPADQSLMSLLSASQSPLSYLNVNAQLNPSTNPTTLMSQLTSAPFAQTPNIAPPNFAQQQTVGA